MMKRQDPAEPEDLRALLNDPIAVFQAFNYAFAALGEALDQAGVIEVDSLADQISRFHPAPDARALVTYHAEIIRLMRERPFRDPQRGLRVIEGGKGLEGDTA